MADTTKKGAPNWATQPFSDLTEDVGYLAQTLEMCIRGISMFRAMPQMVSAIAKAEGTTGQECTLKDLERAQKHADFAMEEAKNGFPILHANTALAAWSHLEAGVRLFLARWLENEKSAFEVDAVQKLKVRICDYERLEGEERYFFILDRVEQETTAPLKAGVKRFEVLLEQFGLSGSVDADLQRDLFELNEVRNCLMHRAGRADRRFVEACPWLGMEVGQKLLVTNQATHRYLNAVMHYAVELVCRVGDHFGVDMSDCRKQKPAEQI